MDAQSATRSGVICSRSVSWEGSKLVLNVRLTQSTSVVERVGQRLHEADHLLDEDRPEDRGEGDDREEQADHHDPGATPALDAAPGHPRDGRLHRDGEEPGQQQQEEQVPDAEEEPLEDLDEQDDGDHGHRYPPDQARVGDCGRHDAGGAPRGGVAAVGCGLGRVRSTHGATVADGATEISDARRRPWGTLVGMLNVRLLLRSRGEA